MPPSHASWAQHALEAPPAKLQRQPPSQQSAPSLSLLPAAQPPVKAPPIPACECQQQSASSVPAVQLPVKRPPANLQTQPGQQSARVNPPPPPSPSPLPPPWGPIPKPQGAPPPTPTPSPRSPKPPPPPRRSTPFTFTPEASHSFSLHMKQLISAKSPPKFTMPLLPAEILPAKLQTQPCEQSASSPSLLPAAQLPAKPPPSWWERWRKSAPSVPPVQLPVNPPPRRGKVAPPANSQRLRCRCFPLPSFPSSLPPRGGNPSSQRPHFQVWSLVSSPSTRICKHSSSSSQQECIRRHHHRPQ